MAGRSNCSTRDSKRHLLRSYCNFQLELGNRDRVTRCKLFRCSWIFVALFVAAFLVIFASELFTLFFSFYKTLFLVLDSSKLVVKRMKRDERVKQCDIRLLKVDDQMKLLQHSWSDMLVLDHLHQRMHNGLPDETTLHNGQKFDLLCLGLLGVPSLAEHFNELQNKLAELKFDVPDYICVKFLLLLNPGQYN